MGIFGGSSKSASYVTEQVEDSRVTGAEASQIASGGGSVVLRESIPQEPIDSILGAIIRADERRSEDYRALLETSARQAGEARASERSVVEKAVETVAAQRQSETETLGATLEKLGPLILGGLLLVVLASGKAARG